MNEDHLQNGNQILVVNCGSSSIKVSLFNVRDQQLDCCLDVHLKDINSTNCKMEIKTSNASDTIPVEKNEGIQDGLKLIFDTLIHKYHFDTNSLRGIGHRFVHGGNKYISSCLIDNEVIKELEGLSDLAPLHNEACLLGIKTCQEYFGTYIPQITVFDTAFHSSLPAIASNYAIPSDLSSKYQIKRYGFHGISNAFILDIYQKHVRQTKNSKIIVMHLGNGCSMTAIHEGKSIETSMGFTPAEGLIMATRAGDIDASLIEFLCVHEKKNPNEVMHLLNFQSGLLGISEKSSSMEILLNEYDRDEKAKLAVDMFCYRLVKYLGAYIAVLGGVDSIIFSGGIGENSPIIRKQIIEKMSWYGIKINDLTNEQAIGLPSGALLKISQISKVDLYVVTTDENLFIANEVLCLKNPKLKLLT